MKSYLQGLITGGVFVFAFMVLMGQSNIRVNDIQEKKRKLAMINQEGRTDYIGRFQIALTSVPAKAYDKEAEIYESIIDTRTGIITSRTMVTPNFFDKP